MIRFRRVSIEGFGVFADKVELLLEDRGLTLISGNNQDSGAASSNGAGKSTIFKAISWALFGVTIDGLKTDVVSHGAPRARVVLYLRAGAHEYAITRTATSARRTLTLEEYEEGSGEWVDRSQGMRETQASIDEVLGLDWDAFRCVCLFGQGDVARFASPGMTDTSRKAVLKQVLGLVRYERARDEARDRRSVIQEKVSTIDDGLHKAEVSISSAMSAIELRESDIESAEAFLEGVEDEYQSVLDRKGAAKSEVDDLREDSLRLNEAVEDAEAFLEDVEDEYERARDLASDAKHKRSDAKRAHKSVSLSECPTCERPFEIDKEERERLAEAVENANKKFERATEIADAFDEEVNEARADVRRVKAERDKVASKLARLEGTLENADEEAAKVLARAEKAERKLEDLREELDALHDELNDALSQKEVFKKKRARFAVDLDALDWWVKGFGPKGVQAYAIEQALPALNAATNRHLLMLADGDLVVRWEATKESKSGHDIEELTCTVEVEGIPDSTPSGGQWKKIELATEIALAEVVTESGGAKVNMLMLDEALDALDIEGVDRVCEWLRTLDYETIFMVSHSHAIDDRFANTITVTKSDGTSTIRD